MNLAHALKHVTDIFRQNNIQDPADEAGVLLCHLLQMDKSRLFAQPETELTINQLADLEKLIQRRLNGEPAAYILRNKEFYGIDLYVDSRVLIPRPETEALVEEATKFAEQYLKRRQNSQRKLLIADVGTGSGAIAIALAVNLPQSIIFATDISEKALEVTAQNVARQGLSDRITLLKGDLLMPLDATLDIIVANLPYIITADIASLAPEIALHEPVTALDGGPQGIRLIGRLIAQSKQKINPGGALLLEIGQGQESAILPLIADVFPHADVSLVKDLSGINRVLKIEFFSFDNDGGLL